MKKLILISMVLMLSVSGFEVFLSSPDQNFYLGSNQAACIETASDESMVVVGFKNGLIDGYTMEGKFLRNFTGHSSSIVQIIWTPGVGPLSLDSSGTLLLNWANGTQAANISVNSGALGMTMPYQLSSLNDISIGVIYSTNVTQYNISLNSSATLQKTYSANNIITASYTSYGSLLIATGNSQIQSFNVSTGNLPYSLANSIDTIQLINNANVVTFQKYGNDTFFMDTQSNLYYINSSGYAIGIAQSVRSASVATVCPSTLYIPVGYTSQSVISVYEGSNLGQQLSYMHNLAIALQCSQNYLVSLDKSNYLAFNSYINDSKLVAWAIAVIVISIVIFIALVVTIIYCCCKRRKQQLLLNNTEYAKELNSTGR